MGLKHSLFSNVWCPCSQSWVKLCQMRRKYTVFRSSSWGCATTPSVRSRQSGIAGGGHRIADLVLARVRPCRQAGQSCPFSSQ
jgi:hypothetical protein